MPVPMPNGKQSYYTTAGAPLVGGRLYTYAAGTSTPKTTWSDAAGTTPNANPVILDSRGEAVVFFSGAYKLELRDAANAVIWSVDNFLAADPTVLIPDGRTTLPSGTTVDLGATVVRSVDITGTSTIQSFGASAADGAVRFLRFTGTCSLTHNATSMILPGGANITVAAGDCAIVQCLGSSNWVVLAYQRAARFEEDNRRAGTLASASTVDIGAAIGRSLDISGTTTITSFGTAPAGTWRMLRFTGALTLTHNATSLILPGGSSITTSAGDTCTAISLGSGNWLVSDFSRAAMPAFRAVKGTAQSSGTTVTSYTEIFDVSGNFDPTAGTFTAPAPGIYHFGVVLRFVNANAGAFLFTTRIAVNGAGALEAAKAVPGGTSTDGMSMSSTLQLAAGDVVSITMASALTANESIAVGYFSGHRVR